MEKGNFKGFKVGSMVILKEMPSFKMEIVRLLRITNLAYCKHVHSENGEITYSYLNIDLLQKIEGEKGSEPGI